MYLKGASCPLCPGSSTRSDHLAPPVGPQSTTSTPGYPEDFRAEQLLYFSIYPVDIWSHCLQLRIPGCALNAYTPVLHSLVLGICSGLLELNIQPGMPLALNTPIPQTVTNLWNTTSPEAAYEGVKGRFCILSLDNLNTVQFSFSHWLQGGSQLHLTFTWMSHFYLSFPTDQSLVFSLTSNLS